MKKWVEITFFWLLPWLGLPWLWQMESAGRSVGEVAYRFLFPALLMYIVVGLGAGRLKRWQFTVPYAISGVLPQIGIIYTTFANLIWLLISNLADAQPLLFVLATGLLAGLAGTLYDMPILHTGLLCVRLTPALRTAPAWRQALSYGPLFFSAVGVVVALGWLAEPWLTRHLSWPWAALVAALTGALPFAIYLIATAPRAGSSFTR